MNYKVISFDMQGTITDLSFADEFWFETLPLLYSQSKKVSLEEAKQILKEKFKEYGAYDFRYYSVNYWLKELSLDLNFKDIKKLIKTKPHFYEDSLELIKELSEKVKLIIISSTTRDFINTELGEYKKYFDKTYSSIDDFNIAGKPQELYEKIAEILNIKLSEIIHIGDSKEMDIENSKKAGLNTFFFDKTKPRNELIQELGKII